MRTQYGDVSPLVFRFRILATMCFVMVFGSCCEQLFFVMVSVQQFTILLFCNVFRSRFGPDCQKHSILSWFPSDNVKNLRFVIVSRSQVQKLFVLQSLSVQIFPPKNDVIWKGVQVSNAKHIGFVGILRRRRRGQGPPGPLSSPSAFTPLALPPALLPLRRASTAFPPLSRSFSLQFSWNLLRKILRTFSEKIFGRFQEIL